MKSNTWLQRLWLALRLNADFYRRATLDTSLNREALLWVIIPTFGLIILGFWADLSTDTGGGFGIFSIGIAAFFFIRTSLTYLIGRYLFRRPITYGQVQRGLGYAYLTRYLSLFIVTIPCIGVFFLPYPLLGDWVAIKAILQVNNVKAFLVIVLQYLLFFVGFLLLVLLISDMVVYFDWLFNRLGF